MSWLFVIILIFVGFVLLLVEIFLIPGINVVGIVGFGSVVWGIYYAYVKLGTWPALSALIVSLIFGGVLIAIIARTRSWSRLILEAREDVDEGFRSSSDELEELVGKEGRALTPLRPAGTAEIGDEKVDVVTEGAFVERGTRVVVADVQGHRVIVRSI